VELLNYVLVVGYIYNMDKEEFDSELNELDQEEIARQVADGNTGGILDNEDGYRISWTLKYEKFEH